MISNNRASARSVADVRRSAPNESREYLDDARRRGTGATSIEYSDDARLCGWCRQRLELTQVLWCGKRCRQAGWRLKRIMVTEGADGKSRRLAYADPPYPKLARKYYRNEPSFAGEVDHRRLLESLTTYDGWALSTSEDALRDILPLCPKGARVCPWVKPIGAAPATRGMHNTWEPLIVMPARQRRPGKRDWLMAQPARGNGTLPGRKPAAFCAFLFEALGAAANDTLDDLFPGTGIVGRSFDLFRGAV